MTAVRLFNNELQTVSKEDDARFFTRGSNERPNKEEIEWQIVSTKKKNNKTNTKNDKDGKPSANNPKIPS